MKQLYVSLEIEDIKNFSDICKQNQRTTSSMIRTLIKNCIIEHKQK